MDALTFTRLKARFNASHLNHRIKSQSGDNEDAIREAGERLGRASLPRPDGALAWIHAPDGLDCRCLDDLLERLETQLDPIHVLITAPRRLDTQVLGDDARIIQHFPPEDMPGPIARFLDHWRPDVGIWLDRADKPLLLDGAARYGMTLFLQNASAPRDHHPRARNLERHLFGLFERVLAVNSTEAEKIRTLGAIPARIETTGPLRPISHPPDCNESEREALAAAIDTRPVWMAAMPDPRELDAILVAHGQVRRTAHRSLLLIVPRDDAEGPAMVQDLRNRGWQVASRELDIEPDPNTDIFVADCLEEIGLFYSLSPVSFLGGSLLGAEIPDPMAPASLGSAMIAGPTMGTNADAIRRLRAADACLRIARPEELGDAVIDLLSPDRAATLALHGWDVASEGSQVLDRLSALICASLRDSFA
ncbi:3-deoxy-D-manno-octulosonic-acid transferase [Aliiruegeria haliotis]|uniref:3-deoxy-D-manno-octulosonic acid transferase n=1 Tax=Aliiruegeria haliotis TaxID=1280846 RepID=A0A2T0RIG3_9RHOB|nr:glycosyltransferase N-terminal domain-containing protein [Aliiruegeria haliotis]PRY20917.1 3-deoxy-D-manno-octulosonic-acid transferase [Aliiruegeria haliotis]